MEAVTYSKEEYLDSIKKEKFGDLGRVYGAQWRNWTNIISDNLGTINYNEPVDQISNLIKGLKENPMGTRHIVTAWNPAETNNMALPPCHWSFEILVEPMSWKSRFNELEELGATYETKANINTVFKKWKIPKYQFTLKWHQRSVDTFLGLPFNIASYSLLAEIIGKLTYMKPKGIIGDLSNVHIYEPHLDAVKKQLSRDIYMYSGCKLHTVNNSILNINPEKENLDELFRLIMIDDFELKDYNSYSRIPAEMLAYSN
jgi:thymidylate synthase